MYLAQNLLNIGIQGCTTNNKAVHLATECVNDLIAYLTAYYAVNTGNSHQDLHHGLFQNRLYLLLDNLLNYKRYGNNQLGLLLSKSIEQDLG